GGVSFHHLGFWTDRLGDSSYDLDERGWPCAASVAGPRTTRPASPSSSPRTGSTSSCSTPPHRATPTCCQSRAAKGKTMNTIRERETARAMTHLGTKRTRPRERTGVRFVLTNATDPSRADDYSAWYDDYENAIIRPGLIANAF